MVQTGPSIDSARLLVVGAADWIPDLAALLESRTGESVNVVTTKATAVEAVSETDLDAVVTGYTLDDATGIELLRTIREETATLPVLLATGEGSEAIASDAVAAGVSDYVVLEDTTDTALEAILPRLIGAMRSANQSKHQRDRARQFDAVFHDSQTATWVLETDGTVARANQAASALVDEEPSVGESFWDLPWWSHSETTQADVQRLIEKARAGTFGNAVVRDPAPDSTGQVIELSVDPVENERGNLVSIVVRGVDISERVSLERDLRQSEELHRVTLNNMTDTVLITDDDGEYTYVCPNVHFIFGYTADEIREKGTIHELLGDDLFDREALEANGILKNIETTATDKAGRTHTLLVNVRKVEIQGGRLLYSCRDITKRKQREEALATLQELARSFLYAETHEEIGQHIVDEAERVLDLPASAVYLFDADSNELRPAANSRNMRALHGPLPSLHADSETLPGHGFIEGSSLFFDDVHRADRLDNPATDLRSVCYIPLGDHGVFVAGSDEVAVFDDVSRELADLLAATAEAALDRVSRESQLRDQDRQLQRQNEQLTTLNRINETIRAIDQALVQAETRDEIDHTVCELLTSDDRFSFAWIGAVDATTDTLEPRAWAGDEQGYLDSTAFTVEAAPTEPAGKTAATGTVTMESNVAAELHEEAWRTNALTRDFMSVLSIPLTYNEFSHGVLTVYADTRDAFDDTARAVLAELGETIGSALSALERKNALLTTSMTRVEFAIDDPTFMLSRLASEADCTLTYEGGVQQTTDGSYVFVAVEDGTLDTVEEVATEMIGIEESSRISGDGDSGVIRLTLTQPFVALELAEHGVVFREASATGTDTSLTIDIPNSIDVRSITQLVTETFASVELTSKQTIDQATEDDIYETFLADLTDRQLEVVQTAYYSGFFDSPRENSGEDVAAMLDVSPQAFYQHVRTVQRKLFEALFDERNASLAASSV